MCVCNGGLVFPATVPCLGTNPAHARERAGFSTVLHCIPRVECLHPHTRLLSLECPHGFDAPGRCFFELVFTSYTFLYTCFIFFSLLLLSITFTSVSELWVTVGLTGQTLYRYTAKSRFRRKSVGSGSDRAPIYGFKERPGRPSESLLKVCALILELLMLRCPQEAVSSGGFH